MTKEGKVRIFQILKVYRMNRAKSGNSWNFRVWEILEIYENSRNIEFFNCETWWSSYDFLFFFFFILPILLSSYNCLVFKFWNTYLKSVVASISRKNLWMFQFPNFQNVSIFLVRKKKLEFFKPLNSIFLNLKYVKFKRKTDLKFIQNPISLYKSFVYMD